MKHALSKGILSLALGLSALTINAENEVETFSEWFAEGSPQLNFRARFEYADQDGRESSAAFTLRTRLGYETASLGGWVGLIDFEDIRALDADEYNPYPVAGKTVIADPEGSELNRLQLSYSGEGYIGVIGRQRIILDGARFVGNVGWRQNEQTYDAFTLKYKNESMSFFYGYIDQVNRIFGDDAPAGAMRAFESDSHLLNASFISTEGVKLVAYGYLLDFENAAANSSDTFGVSVSGSNNFSGGPELSYHLEYAIQSDGGNSPLNYSTDYLHLNVGGKFGITHVKLGYEVLGSDDGVGFKTPLATLHKFNGWADTFLGTPGAGLEDLYLQVGGKFSGVTANLIYHNFSADRGGASYGDEFDFVVIKPINKQWKIIGKAATFSGSNGRPDVDKFWLETDFNF